MSGGVRCRPRFSFSDESGGPEHGGSPTPFTEIKFPRCTLLLIFPAPAPLRYSPNPTFRPQRMTVTAKKDTEVVIVGAGPVGLIIALMIARQGIKVVLCEAFSEIIQSPRAMAYGPAAVIELERAGVAAECREIGMEPSDYEFTLRWITIDNQLVADLPSRLMEGYPPVLCGQHLVADIILKHLEKLPNAKVLWNHKVVGIEQDKDSVTAVCETKDGEKRVTGEYLVGADGARSTVRKLIGCTFDGFTYDKMVVATNVFYPFREYGWASGQFIIHPEHFAMVISPFNRRGLTRGIGGQDFSRWNVPCFVRRGRLVVVR